MNIHYNPNEDKETVLIDRFGLTKYSEVYNRKYDAIDSDNNYYELKSTSKSSVSTARDLGINHINKWRGVNWIVGFWNRESSQYEDIYLLRPEAMKIWLDKMEKDFRYMESLCSDIITNSLPFDEHEYPVIQRILRRGCTKNDPNIPNTYIRKNGIQIDTKEELTLIMKEDTNII